MVALTSVALGGLLFLSSGMAPSIGWTAQKEPPVFSGTLIEDLMTGGSGSKDTAGEEISEKAVESHQSDRKTGMGRPSSKTKHKAAGQSDDSAATSRAKDSGKGKSGGSGA
ncbi:MAG: hypothetical protein P8182_17805, partial [Deltaproteobacteria bacterium]